MEPLPEKGIVRQFRICVGAIEPEVQRFLVLEEGTVPESDLSFILLQQAGKPGKPSRVFYVRIQDLETRTGLREFRIRLRDSDHKSVTPKLASRNELVLAEIGKVRITDRTKIFFL